jgi:hypothetical protein
LNQTRAGSALKAELLDAVDLQTHPDALVRFSIHDKEIEHGVGLAGRAIAKAHTSHRSAAKAESLQECDNPVWRQRFHREIAVTGRAILWLNYRIVLNCHLLRVHSPMKRRVLDLTLASLVENLAARLALLEAESSKAEVLQFWEWPTLAVIRGVRKSGDDE